MIKAIIYDKTANTVAGVTQGEMRVVGFSYHTPAHEDPVKLEVIREDVRREQKVIVLSYSEGVQQIIPDRGVEKILKVE